MKPSPRQWLALALLGVFVYLTANLAPYFIRNLRLQQSVEEITRSVGIPTQSPDAVRERVVARARQLGLPVEASDVQVAMSGNSVRISIRYVVKVDLPGYTVKLHFAI